MKTFPRKILVSPGYGAGWSSWCEDHKAAQFVAEYEPIIEFLDNGGKKNSRKFDKLIDDLQDIVKEKYDVDFYAGGTTGLEVRWVNGPYRIVDYDGAEKVEEMDCVDMWFY